MADVANVIVIGASAGGHRALTEVIKNLPADLPAAIVILLHMQLGSPYRLKETLARYSRLPIIEVEGEAPLREGAMYIPLGGRSATFGDGTLSVGGDIPTRPLSTINHVFKSAAQTYGEHVIGVILSGLLRDGTDGLRAVHDAGGLTVVQDPSEAEYADMPANAMQTLPVTFCLNLADIGPALELLVRRTARFETGLAVAVRTLRDRAALLVRLGEQSWRNAGTRDFLRQELASLRRDIQSIDELVAASSLKG
jgi:two-component system chemotaxis response regulator CheB